MADNCKSHGKSKDPASTIPFEEIFMSLLASLFHGRRAVVWITMALTALSGAWCGANADVARPTAHELAAIESQGTRLWYHEEEFSRRPQLRAEPHHVVILNLEAGERKGKTVRNAIPYRFARTETYTFCIPKDERRIRSIELRRDGGKGNGVEVRVPHGAGCKTRTIPAGLYQLHVEHDGRNIGSAGEKAFVHVPRVRDSHLTRAVSDLSTCDGGVAALTAPSGIFVFPLDVSAGDLAYRLIAQAGIQPGVQVDLATGGFRICKGSDGTYTFASAPQADGTNYFNSLDGQFGAPYLYALPDKPSQYEVTDLGNFQIAMTWIKDSTNHNPIVMDGNFLRWVTIGAPAIFTIPVKYYPPGAEVPSLQSGEAAFSWGDATTNGTWVVRADLPDATGIGYGLGSAGHPNQHLNTSFGSFPLSVRVGPDTVATVYAAKNYQTVLANIGGDTSCLACGPSGVTPFSFESIRITRARDFIIATNSCRNCNLSGVDLSQLDLSNGFFAGSTFTGANLSNTIFDSAVLDNVNMNGASTDFTGTRFLSTRLLCANFTDANLANLDGIEAIITQDFSCRMNLIHAIFNLDTFPLSQWRFFDLTGAKISGLSGAVLSTTSNPLNLSGAILKNTDLSQVVLDGANLGCDTINGIRICTQLSGANLNGSSLRRANLENAVLQGANLSFSNLDGADMCAAKLNQSDDQNVSASLQGAFLRNVNLFQADFTGASLADANFYSTVPSSAATCLKSCGLSSSCASAVSARFNNTDFSGAYLAGVDFSDSFPQSANFAGATLSGSNFTNANLTQDVSTGKRTNFTAAFLQGTDFTNATVTGANFIGAVVDLSSAAGLVIKEQLEPATHLAFPGYTPMMGSTPGCVQFATNKKTVLPKTDSSNICPSGGQGSEEQGCTTIEWQAPAPPEPACIVDFNWLFVTY